MQIMLMYTQILRGGGNSLSQLALTAPSGRELGLDVPFCCLQHTEGRGRHPFRMTASMSSTVRGMAADRFSHPVSVTRQLSSRRKPMPHSSW